MINPFFLNTGPYYINHLIKKCNITNIENLPKILVFDVKDLAAASSKDITFYHSIKYKEYATSTKASLCITNNKLKNHLPEKCIKVIVDNVLLSMANITKIFYPDSICDDFDKTVNEISKTIFKNKVSYGHNVLIGSSVEIGKNCKIGHNTIIEKNVKIGDNCSIGSNVIIRNTIIKSNVHILDGCIIGKKGFGFFPNNLKNIRYPHIGIVIIEENCEIGSGSSIDRGSLSDTIIGKNTFLDNQIHIAHNNKIGENCIIAGQVGIAGSSTIGNNVMIGGQAGISGHLKIGNFVQIGGGSGVLDNVPDKSKLMGYPAKNIREFIKNKNDT